MITTILLIGLIMYSVGVVLICLEKQKLGTALMLTSPVGLAIFVYLGDRVGVVESVQIYLSTLCIRFQRTNLDTSKSGTSCLYYFIIFCK